MEIFKLFGSVAVDTTDAEKSLSKTDEKAEGLGKKLQSGIQSAGKWATGLGSAAAKVGKAMLSSAKETADNLDVIDKASQRMKISAESYQELAYAANMSGVEMSTLEKAAKKLDGTGLGINDALEQIYALEDADQRAAMAAELFGDAVAYSMTPMLNASAEEMAAMRQEANDLGLVMSEESVKAGAEFNDQYEKIESSLNAVKSQVASALLPVLTDVFDWIVKHLPEIQSFVSKTIDFVKSAIAQIIPIIEALSPVIKNVFEIIGNLWDKYLQPILMGIIEFLDGVFSGDWEKIFSGLAKIVENIFGAIVEIVKKPINGIIELLNSAIDGFNKIQIPEWVPAFGGMGLNIPHIPLLANGGDITKEGTVMVGEAGPELLTLPEGARVTPLDKVGNEIDYDKITESFIAALNAVLPTMQTQIIAPGAEDLFKIVRNQSVRNAQLGKPSIVV